MEMVTSALSDPVIYILYLLARVCTASHASGNFL